MNLRKIAFLFLTTIILLTPLIGCNSKDDTAGKAANEQSSGAKTLVIASAFPEVFVRDQYINKYELTHPELEVKIIDFSDKLMQLNQQVQRKMAATDEEQTGESIAFIKMYEDVLQMDPTPDIIILNGDIIGELVEQDLLTPLDPLMEQHQFSKERLHPNLLKYLQDMGNGSLYGLVTGFNTQALFYNKTLFENAGVELPHDGMTWSDVQQLAIQMTNLEQETPRHGLDLGITMQGQPFMFLIEYARPYDISFIEPTDRKLIMDVGEWPKLWQEVVDMYQAGFMPPLKNQNDLLNTQDPESIFPGFYQGKVAMMPGYAMELEVIKNIKDISLFDDAIKGHQFDVVTFPVHAAYPDVGSSINFTNIYSIPKGANNVEAAWDFLEYITSPEVLQYHNDMLDPLPAFQDQAFKNQEVNYEAFYQLRPAPYQKSFSELPTIFDIYQVGNEELSKAIRNEISVEEAIANFQHRAQPLLDEGFKELDEERNK